MTVSKRAVCNHILYIYYTTIYYTKLSRQADIILKQLLTTWSSLIYGVKAAQVKPI